MKRPLGFVFIGLTITSAWGNGHATSYRALLRRLARRGHRVLVLEHNVPWHAANRDHDASVHGPTELYKSTAELLTRFANAVRDADVVVVGSFVPDGVAVGEWVVQTARGIKAFYDMNAPATLSGLTSGATDYLSRSLVPRYDLYLSSVGGPTLARLCNELGAQRVKPLYCSCDPDFYYPENRPPQWELGFLGSYSKHRQEALERLLFDSARYMPTARFVVAGSQYPQGTPWPPNVEYIEHVAPPLHRAFYTSQLATLNVTRPGLAKAGYAPSVRLFEAAACATPMVSDSWPGLDSLFEPGKEILLASCADEVYGHLSRSHKELQAIGRAARRRVLAEHTSLHRAAQLESYLAELLDARGTTIDRAAAT